MRLNEQERNVIKSAVTKHFGDDAQVWLFGSRTDDSQRGGDIDLLVETELTGRDALRAKINTITDIQLSLGDQKIDLVTFHLRQGSGTDRQPLIITNASRQGVPL
ncbi:MAG: nucleotidyltransferase domain-containing protein [Spirochaetaceae bacterium]|nr:MAG: nucleotidyltransferase domain-containing protein [Spirochaetaceae bacterium]